MAMAETHKCEFRGRTKSEALAKFDEWRRTNGEHVRISAQLVEPIPIAPSQQSPLHFFIDKYVIRVWYEKVKPD